MFGFGVSLTAPVFALSELVHPLPGGRQLRVHLPEGEFPMGVSVLVQFNGRVDCAFDELHPHRVIMVGMGYEEDMSLLMQWAAP